MQVGKRDCLPYVSKLILAHILDKDENKQSNYSLNDGNIDEIIEYVAKVPVVQINAFSASKMSYLFNRVE